MCAPPNAPGTYALILAADYRRDVLVGKHGTLAVEPGSYVYVGSARGAGGLASRIARHLSADKTLRWHVDYLRTVTRVVEAWWAQGEERQECGWAAALSRMSNLAVPLSGFGASDCGCKSHLFRFEVQPRVRAFHRELAAVLDVSEPELRILVSSVAGSPFRCTEAPRAV